MSTLQPDWFNWPHIKALKKTYAAHTEALRFVGGCVRDTLLGRPVSDIDMATSLSSQEVMDIAQSAGIKAIPTGIAHGTVTVVIEGKPIEITTLRKDSACDGRHASVEFTGNWEEDAVRRDFTMNALYLGLDGALYDYAGGEVDARAGKVCFIGEAALRIQEDYLRILRFFRFFAVYGKVLPEKTDLQACSQNKAGIGQLSGERIQAEMFKLLAAENPVPALELMEKAGILAELIEPANITRLAALLAIGHKSDVHTRLAALLQPEQIGPLAQRWKLSNASSSKLACLHEALDKLDVTSTEATQKKLIRKAGKENFVQLVMLARAHKGGDAATYESMIRLAAEWQIPAFPVSGEDLKAAGFPEGKKLGDALSALENKWEASDYTLDKKALLAAVK